MQLNFYITTESEAFKSAYFSRFQKSRAKISHSHFLYPLTKYGVSLPAHFRAFLLEIADGGGGFDGSAPGPFYGIYPIKDALKFSAPYLANPCLLRPKMSDEQWRAIGGFAYEQECGDEESEEEKILGG